MLYKEIRRMETLSAKVGKKEANPDEERELLDLKTRLSESGGVESGFAGLVVASNHRWLYKPYLTLQEQSQIAQDDDLEQSLYWESVRLIESHIKSNGDKSLLKDRGGEVYYRTLSGYLQSGRLKTANAVWEAELLSAKWTLLRGRLKSLVAELLRKSIETDHSTVGSKIEDRVEPLFNKIVKQLNTEVDADSLSIAEKIKVMDRLSSLLADMKGEKKQPETLQVTHNNVFNVIMENKKESKQLQRAAVELREGDGYELM